MSQSPFRYPKLSEPRIVLLAAAGFLGLGILLAGDYGLSTDEPIQALYGRTTMWHYLGLGSDSYGPANLPYYGPAFSALVEILGFPLQVAIPGWTIIDARHFVYFLSFVLGSLALYDIARRLVRPSSAFVAALLFASQPLLFGHAFINPKDIPFMSFFLATFALGLRGFDRLSHSAGRAADEPDQVTTLGMRNAFGALGRRWKEVSRRKRILVIGAFGLLAAGVIELYWTRILLRYGLNLIEQAYAGQAPPLINDLFNLVASRAGSVSLDSYLSRAEAFYSIPQRWGLIFLILQAAVMTVSFLGWKRVRPVFGPWAPLLGAGVLLGLTISIRVAGPFVGVLLSIYCISACERRARSLLVLWGVAVLTTFLTWPALWSDPLGHLFESIRVMMTFSHTSLELYDGELIPANRLPPSFAPRLVVFQLTEPALGLALLGMVAQLRLVGTGARNLRVLWGLVLLWFVLPIAAQVALQSTIYNNFRVLLFAIPPVFIFGALGVEFLHARIRRSTFWWVVMALLLAPGITAIVRLHPYEYIYYNTLAGGIAAASERYESDYWCTSLREAMEQVNQIAPEGARVGVHRVSDLAKPFARPDLDVRAVDDEQRVRNDPPDYLLVCPRSDFDRTYLADYSQVWRVSRAGADLTVVRTPER